MYTLTHIAWHSNAFAHTHTLYLGVAAEKAVGDRDVEVKVEGMQDFGFHGDELRALVGVITDVQEVIDTRWASLLSERKTDLSVLF